jgi:hypothetical protein
MMAAIRIVSKIVDDRLRDFVMRLLGTIKNIQFTLENEQQGFDIAMIFAENLNEFGHHGHLAGAAPLLDQGYACGPHAEGARRPCQT